MTIAENKSWMTHEFYHEYLELKTKIQELVTAKNHFARQNDLETQCEIEQQLTVKVDRLQHILCWLKQGGVKPEDLILLSLGVDVLFSP